MAKTRQRKQNLLTARAIAAAREEAAIQTGNGLYLVVRDGGSKQWMFLYRREGKLKEMGLGSPAKGVTLAMARDRCNEARAILAGGRDPLEARRQSEQAISGIPPGRDEASLDAVAKAIDRFEEHSKFRDFKKFHVEQVRAFKAHLRTTRNVRTGEPLSASTIYSTFAALKVSFANWLSQEQGYRSRIKLADAEYFNSPDNLSRTGHGAPIQGPVRRSNRYGR